MITVFLGITGMLLGQGTTTSAINGLILDEAGLPLPGATVVAVHVPSGTQYGTATSVDGRFFIPGMRVGGPYIVKISFIGYSSWEQEDIFINLGAPFLINVTLAESGIELATVVVTAKPGSVGQNSGTSTRVSGQEISELPSANRDLNDFLRLTPQSSSYGDGITFAGVNNRFNAVYIDGAVNNDVFGLASSGTNGGQTGISPFSIDIIDQLQVVISPYDVSLGGFAGGGVNAVTKSGTNTFKGSAYTYLRNQNLVGKTSGVLAERLDVERTKVDDFTESIYGFSLGGPIIKDKLFFFGNVEIQRDETPRPFEISEYTSVPGRVSVADLNDLRNFLITNYDYDPGSFGNTSDELNGLKIFGKLDYNLNENHRLTLRHQYTKAEQFSRYSGSSSRVNFSNNGIYFPSTTNSTALEINSRYGLGFSNNLIISFVSVRDDRNPIGKNFPYVYIDDASSGQITFGSEEFSTANRLDQNIISLTNNFNIYRGSHKFTIGTHNEFYDIYNVFIGQNFGTYRFANLDAFLNGLAATRYDRSYSLIDDITGDGTAAAGDFRAMQFGLYAQDQWSVNRNLVLTGGLRVDLPVITTKPGEDTYFNNTALPEMVNYYPIAEGIAVGETPDMQLMLSPRLGFSYDINGDLRNVIRGGLGIFTSRIPFVWPGAMFTNNGLTLGRVSQSNIPGGVFFNPDYQTQYVHPSPTIPAGQIDIFTRDFKYPQVFRTNLGFDFTLPWGIVSTVEGLFTKTLNNVNYTNINSDPTVDFTWTGTPDNRPVYVNQNINSTYSAVYLASNTSQGYTYNLSASFAKDFIFGLSATVAYSFGDAYALSEGTSSQNSSQWRGQVNVNGRNNPSFGRSDFAVGHRFLSSLSYSHKWSADGNNKTTISLFVNGQSGTPFSYIISGSNARNLNAERGSTSRNRSLAFIPADASQINLVDYTVGTTTITAAQQWANLDKYIEEDAYLSKNRGKYAEKNGAWSPFTTIFDIAVRQDIGLNIGGQSHKLQVSLDISNFGNMLNSKWGTIYSVPGDFNNYYLYQFEGYEGDGTTPRFTYRTDKTGLDSFDISGLASRWSMLLGIKYFFN
jgi:hypothetical protein